jgi:hypothetical protein
VPSRFVYQPNPTGALWFEMERAADAAGYQVFNAKRPSSLYVQLTARLGEAPWSGGPLPAWNTRSELRSLVTRSGARSLLCASLAPASTRSDAEPGSAPEPGKPSVTHGDLSRVCSAVAAPELFDGVACADLLEFLPDEDGAWAIDALFAAARRFVHAVVRDDVRRTAERRIQSACREPPQVGRAVQPRVDAAPTCTGRSKSKPAGSASRCTSVTGASVSTVLPACG